MLDEIKENEVPKVQENQEQQKVPKTPSNVKRSTGLSRPSEIFYPSSQYLLMANLCELECHEEAMWVENRNKSERHEQGHGIIAKKPDLGWLTFLLVKKH